MPVTPPFPATVRLRRLFHRGDGRLFVVPLDHSVTDGPVTTGRLDDLVGQVVKHGADAVVLHRGAVRYVDPARFTGAALVVHLSAGTVRAPDPDARCLVSTVEDALRLGADAVSVHLNLGSAGEQRQLADLAGVAAACAGWRVPLLAMVYPRGPGVRDPRDPGLLAHGVALAADLGADVVKTLYPGSVAAMRRVAAAGPVPVIVAGGPRAGGDPAGLVRAALRGGAAGIAAGRHVFQADDPGAVAAQLAGLVHGPDPTTTGDLT